MPTSPMLPGDDQHLEDSSNEIESFPLEESPVEPIVDPSTSEAEPASSEHLLPTEAQGEMHGGPLGCCLGTVVGLLLTFLLITGVSILLSNGGYLSFATLPVILVGAALGGYFGWKVGKKVYREYDPPVIKERRPRRKEL